MGDNTIGHILQAQRGQLHEITEYLGDISTDGHTITQISKTTGIEKSIVCKMVAILRRERRIWSCGKHLDPQTGSKAEYMTTNPNVALRHFAKSCMPLLEGKDQDTQVHILEALKAYVLYKRDEFSIFNPPNREEVRKIWETKVKPMIDKEVG